MPQDDDPSRIYATCFAVYACRDCGEVFHIELSGQHNRLEFERQAHATARRCPACTSFLTQWRALVLL